MSKTTGALAFSSTVHFYEIYKILDYCKNYSLFEPIELDDETNKKIDELIKELKANDVDITDLDNRIIRQYFLGPYLHSNEKRYIIDNDYGKSIYFWT